MSAMTLSRPNCMLYIYIGLITYCHEISACVCVAVECPAHRYWSNSDGLVMALPRGHDILIGFDIPADTRR